MGISCIFIIHYLWRLVPLINAPTTISIKSHFNNNHLELKLKQIKSLNKQRRKFKAQDVCANSVRTQPRSVSKCSCKFKQQFINHLEVPQMLDLKASKSSPSTAPPLLSILISQTAASHLQLCGQWIYNGITIVKVFFLFIYTITVVILCLCFLWETTRINKLLKRNDKQCIRSGLVSMAVCGPLMH